MSKIFFHGNFEDPSEWSFLGNDWKVFPLWEFLKGKSFATWEEGIEALKREVESLGAREVAGYSLGGRVLLGLADAGLRAKSFTFFSTHPGLIREEDRTTRIWQDLQWKEKVLTEEWSELFREWNAQAIFANDPKLFEVFAPLEKYREEIAHAFDFLSLGRMPDFSKIKFPKDADVGWVCGQHDHKFRTLGETFCKHHPKVRYLVAFGQGHRMKSFASEIL